MPSYRPLCCRTYDPRGKYLAIDESVTPIGKRYWYLEFDGIGSNYRMTDMQAAVGLVQLSCLQAFSQRRIEIAKKYTEGLSGIRGLQLPHIEPDRKHVFHVYTVLVKPEFPLNKENFMWELYTGKSIKVWSYYMPMHLTEIYRRLGHKEGECPVAEKLFDQYVSIPIHPRLTDEAIQYVIDSIRELA